MKVETNDPRPPYVQIVDALRADIRGGKLPPGQRLPSGRDLAAAYGVAVMTAQKAIDTLKSEGLLRTYRGRGTFVLSSHNKEGTADDLTNLRTEVDHLRRRVEALESGLSNRRKRK